MWNRRVWRRRIRELSLNLRPAGYSSLELLNRRSSVTAATVLLSGLLDDTTSSDSDNESTDSDKSLLDLVGLHHVQQIVDIDRPRVISQRRPLRRPIRIIDFSDSECWSRFRFRKIDLPRLLGLLNMPPYLRSDNGLSFDREFSLLLFLRRMSYPGRLQDLEAEFGRDYSSRSRSVRATCDWLRNNHVYRIRNNLGFWNAYQQMFVDAIGAKGQIPQQYRNVTSFLDGTFLRTCRPSDGIGRPIDCQRLLYSGYYRGHGFKFQSLMYPNGRFLF
jgi:hypothetical protein